MLPTYIQAKMKNKNIIGNKSYRMFELMKKKLLFYRMCILIIIFSACTQLPVFSHSGRTDENGGHYDHSTDEYHYHDGSSAGQNHSSISFSEKYDNTGSAEENKKLELAERAKKAIREGRKEDWLKEDPSNITENEKDDTNKTKDSSTEITDFHLDTKGGLDEKVFEDAKKYVIEGKAETDKSGEERRKITKGLGFSEGHTLKNTKSHTAKDTTDKNSDARIDVNVGSTTTYNNTWKNNTMSFLLISLFWLEIYVIFFFDIICSILLFLTAYRKNSFMKYCFAIIMYIVLFFINRQCGEFSNNIILNIYGVPLYVCGVPLSLYIFIPMAIITFFKLKKKKTTIR